MSDSIADQSALIRAFHVLYYEKRQRQTWRNTFWFGVQAKKNPLDLWMYQELIHRVRPDMIIETGVDHGGTTLYLAHLFDLLGAGSIIGVDIELSRVAPAVRHHPRIALILGSSTDQDVFARISEASTRKRVMVILDSNHAATHVRRELALYSRLVTMGSYLIVEDTNINGHPALPNYGPGPFEAVKEFLQEHSEFVVDRECEKFMLSFSPDGFLRRVR